MIGDFFKKLEMMLRTRVYKRNLDSKILHVTCPEQPDDIATGELREESAVQYQKESVLKPCPLQERPLSPRLQPPQEPAHILVPRFREIQQLKKDHFESRRTTSPYGWSRGA